MRSLVLALALVLAVVGCAAPEVAPTPQPPTERATTPASPTPASPTPATPSAPTGPATPVTPTSPVTPVTPTSAQGSVRLELAFEGFSRPLGLTHDHSGALYVVEQDGRVWRLSNGSRDLWLDIDAQVGSEGNEQGLLGLAFEPGADRAYVSYTDTAGDSVLERVSPGGAREPLLRVDQPFSNHNGGHVAFGPDGLLYYGLGDGGSANDPQGNGQDPDALLGSMLRLDVANGSAEPEIWAKGLRNPWRFSFDRATGDLFIADVGQGAWEEIDYAPAGSPPGLNFGWAAYEANERNELRSAFSEVTPPVHAYPLREDGHCAVIGGHVYRGAAVPALVGEYLFGDHCSGEIWGLRFVEGAWRVRLLLDTDHNITSFGEDAEGEVYVVAREGAVYRFAP